MNSRNDAVAVALSRPDASRESEVGAADSPSAGVEWLSAGNGAFTELIRRFEAARAALHEEIARFQARLLFSDAVDAATGAGAAGRRDGEQALSLAQFQSFHAALMRISENMAALALDARSLAALREELSRARGSIEESETEVRRLERSLAQRYEELASLTAMLAERDAELQDAARELARTREKLRAIERSPGWRVAAPLRYCAGLFAVLGGARSLARDRELLEGSELFDAPWYLKNYPDVAVGGMNAAEHYLRFGAREGRNPGPRFDTDWYLESNPDVAAGKQNPLVHYLRHGAAEGRTPRR